jgi:hypothetical protein
VLRLQFVVDDVHLLLQALGQRLHLRPALAQDAKLIAQALHLDAGLPGDALGPPHRVIDLPAAGQPPGEVHQDARRQQSPAAPAIRKTMRRMRRPPDECAAAARGFAVRGKLHLYLYLFYHRRRLRRHSTSGRS